MRGQFEAEKCAGTVRCGMFPDGATGVSATFVLQCDGRLGGAASLVPWSR